MNDRKVKYAFDKVLKKGKTRRCLLAGKQCSGAAIEAHSIQNSAVLEGLAEDGHVYMLRPNVETHGVRLKYTGRNVASTFSGFCSFHDTKLFSEIDFSSDTVPQIFSEKQMMLFFLRAISIEGWKKQNIVNSFEDLAQALEKNDINKVSTILGLSEVLTRNAIKNPEAITASTLGHIQGLEDMEEIMGALLWQIENEKFHGTVTHHFTLNSRSNVAVVSGFSPLWDVNYNGLYGNLFPGLDEKMCHMGLTVFEANGKTHVFISYQKKARQILQPLAEQIAEIAKNETKFKKWLTEFILENCENVAFRPSFIDSLSVEQKTELERAAEWSMLSTEPPKKDLSFSFFS